MAKTESTNAESFTKEERAAMKERARELKIKQSQAEAEQEVLDRIASMREDDREIASGLHALVKEHAPHLGAKTWYGMPAYTVDGKVVLFFKDAAKFKSKYATLGFEEASQLDDGTMWPTSFALLDLKANEKQVIDLIKRAAGV